MKKVDFTGLSKQVLSMLQEPRFYLSDSIAMFLREIFQKGKRAGERSAYAKGWRACQTEILAVLPSLDFLTKKQEQQLVVAIRAACLDLPSMPPPITDDPPKLTPEDVIEALEKSAKGAQKLGGTLKEEHQRIPEGSTGLKLD